MPTADEIKNQGAPSGDNQTQRDPQPIGVPYAVYNPNTQQYERWGAPAPPTGPGSLGTQGPGTAPSGGIQLPRYYDGDELMPANWDPNRITDLQRSMVAAGLIPKSANIHLGRWDQVSQKGFSELLAYANGTGQEWLPALTSYGSAQQTNESGRQPLTARVTNPADLAAVFRKAWMDTTGFGIDQAKVDQMVASFQGIETGSQQQAYGMADTGGTVTAPPDPGVFAAKQARDENPLLAQEHDVIKPGGPLDAFKQMLGGWQ